MAMYDDLLNSIKESSAANTAQSQAFAREEMAFNAEQAALTRSWQENMSNRLFRTYPQGNLRQQTSRS